MICSISFIVKVIEAKKTKAILAIKTTLYGRLILAFRARYAGDNRGVGIHRTGFSSSGESLKTSHP